MNKWEIYEYLKRCGYSDKMIPSAKSLKMRFPNADREEILEGIEEYKAAKWLRKGA
ncbi:hypothetical protein NST28_29235 [Paenibacillus sp. FSL R10-2791]|uniref:hypothetical protein n=1 Tax=Paenibacillus TaxID=44249 RepID=UPI000FAE5C01|nr:hypothetical protein [Paenibacillus odorifer]